MACDSFAALRPEPEEPGFVFLLPYLKFDPIPQTSTALSIGMAMCGRAADDRPSETDD